MAQVWLLYSLQCRTTLSDGKRTIKSGYYVWVHGLCSAEVMIHYDPLATRGHSWVQSAFLLNQFLPLYSLHLAVGREPLSQLLTLSESQFSAVFRMGFPHLLCFFMIVSFIVLCFFPAAFSAPVHGGKGMRITSSEKVQPSRGRCSCDALWTPGLVHL